MSIDTVLLNEWTKHALAITESQGKQTVPIRSTMVAICFRFMYFLNQIIFLPISIQESLLKKSGKCVRLQNNNCEELNKMINYFTVDYRVIHLYVREEFCKTMWSIMFSPGKEWEIITTHYSTKIWITVSYKLTKFSCTFIRNFASRRIKDFRYWKSDYLQILLLTHGVFRARRFLIAWKIPSNQKQSCSGLATSKSEWVVLDVVAQELLIQKGTDRSRSSSPFWAPQFGGRRPLEARIRYWLRRCQMRPLFDLPTNRFSKLKRKQLDKIKIMGMVPLDTKI